MGSSDIKNKNNVVYKLQIKDCEASYVGQTGRKLRTRIKEHESNTRSNYSRHSMVTCKGVQSCIWLEQCEGTGCWT